MDRDVREVDAVGVVGVQGLRTVVIEGMGWWWWCGDEVQAVGLRWMRM